MPRLEALIPRYSKGNSGQNHNMKIANIYHESMTKFKYFSTTLTNQSTQKENKSHLNVGNVCYQFYPESFFFFSGILEYKDKINRTLTLPVVLYGFEYWSLKLRGQHKLPVLKARC